MSFGSNQVQGSSSLNLLQLIARRAQQAGGKTQLKGELSGLLLLRYFINSLTSRTSFKQKIAATSQSNTFLRCVEVCKTAERTADSTNNRRSTA